MALTTSTNIPEIDEQGTVTNADLAQERAAQRIHRHCDPSYQVKPPFEPSETEPASP